MMKKIRIFINKDNNMGEIADDILNGFMCQLCGCWMPELEECKTQDEVDEWFNNPPGYPRTCVDCLRGE
jgi:hypothetical protein